MIHQSAAETTKPIVTFTGRGGKNRPARYRILVKASGALEPAARGDLVGFDAAAAGTYGFTIGFRPAQFAERLIGLGIAHAVNVLKGHGAGSGGN
jgi:hypothetical protein